MTAPTAPDSADALAREIAEWFRGHIDLHPDDCKTHEPDDPGRCLADRIAAALLAAEARGREAALEEAAKVIEKSDGYKNCGRCDYSSLVWKVRALRSGAAKDSK